jgi:hypothetical protein
MFNVNHPPHGSQSGRDKHEAEIGDGLTVRNKTTGAVERKSFQVAKAEIEAGIADLVQD